MSSIFVVKIPGWRTFVFPAPTFRRVRESVFGLFGRHFRSPIFAAIEAGRDDDVLRLATPARLRKARGAWGASPLVAAIAASRTELAVQLIQRGGTFPNDGAVAHAAMRGDLNVLEALLAAGANPDEPLNDNLPGSEGVTALMWATNRKFYACMERLLDAGANVNAQAKDGTTAVMYTRAGEPEDLKALEILCRWKPDITLKDGRGRNLVIEARDRERFGGNPAMRLLLERYFAKIE